MIPSKGLLALLLAATLLVDAVVYLMSPKLGVFSVTGSSHPADILQTALVSAEISLLGIWFVIGCGRWFVRLAGLVAGTAAWGFVVSLYEQRVWILCAIASLVVLLGLFWRWNGYRWQRLAAKPAVKQDPATVQFSLANLFGWTAAVACVLLIYRLGWIHWGLLELTIVTTFAVTAWIAVWTAVGNGLEPGRIVTLLSVSAAFGFVPMAFPHAPGPSQFMGWVTTHVLHGILVTGWLWTVRAFGFPIVKSRS